MTINGGNHASAGSRRLRHATDTNAYIAYAICRDAPCAQPITIGGSVGIAVTTGNTQDVQLPIHAQLTLPGNLPSGNYNDTVVVTLTW